MTLKVGSGIRLTNPPRNPEDIPSYLVNLVRDLENILNTPLQEVPSGGGNGQVLTKASVQDFDLEWTTPSGGGGGGLGEEFETVSKNLQSWDYSLNYSGGVLTSIVYTNGVDTITKTLNYTGPTLTSIVLSGDTPLGIDLTKTLSYTGSDLTGVSYS